QEEQLDEQAGLDQRRHCQQLAGELLERGQNSEIVDQTEEQHQRSRKQNAEHRVAELERDGERDQIGEKYSKATEVGDRLRVRLEAAVRSIDDTEFQGGPLHERGGVK